ncbi:MAG: glutathione S-transferase family protein [Rhodanobacteraceae bacterium]|nr:glutathione S-transferase family protein [Rhodanobacteraceae bacterium]
MSLELYGHRFSSYTQKVLVALYENATPFEFRCIAPAEPQHVAEWLRRSCAISLAGRLRRSIVETSIIEYLQLVHPGPLHLLPSDPMAALQVPSSTATDLDMDGRSAARGGWSADGDPVKRREGRRWRKQFRTRFMPGWVPKVN